MKLLNLRTMAIWALLFFAFFFAVVHFSGESSGSTVPVSEFIVKASVGDFRFVTFKGPNVNGVDKTSQTFHRTYADDPAVRAKIIEALHAAHTPYELQPPEQWGQYLGMAVKVGILLLFLMLMMRGPQQNSAINTFARSKHKRLAKETSKTTFKDVAGADEAVEEMRDLVAYLENPKDFQRLGGRVPKGTLLVGPPGTGKTLLARAIAGEAKVPFFYISGSDFVEMFVGVGAARVRDLFESAKKDAPCIVFIDEIDAVGRHRGAGIGGGHDEREQTLNQLLVEMDGFEPSLGVIFIAATNRPDVLDPALLRPGRFDRQVVVERPDLKGRLAILAVHAKKVPLGPDVDLSVVARSTPGLVGADLESLLNEAALRASRLRKASVDMHDIEFAKDKVLMGPERKSALLSDKERLTVAYHEGGHTLVGWLTPEANPVHKVTIIPRGRALGLTHALPESDRSLLSRAEIIAEVDVLLGGRVAEEVVFNEVTTGASNDLDRVTRVVRDMVCKYGMSDLGPRTFGKREQMVFLGRDLAEEKDYSEATLAAIDAEVRKIIEARHARVRDIIKEKCDLLEALAKELIERETLGAADLERILGPRPKHS